MAEQPTTLTLDQALFGYADGHRQLAASVDLPSEDAYELATRSDLAPDARLENGDSYVSGFTLKRSNSFAFIKTWLAPEMRRPGCVWSHILILPRSLLVGQVDLGVLQGLFRRPSLRADFLEYRQRLVIHRLAKTKRADADTVRNVISAYYGCSPFMSSNPPEACLERAILAVWSQQWPKLRSDFVFRTVFDMKGDPAKELLIAVGMPRIGIQHRGPDTERAWLTAAVADAVSTTITPLRRFLWRYGRDVSHPREAFEPLLSLFLESEPGATSTSTATAVLDRFSKATDAVTLKRDLLGVHTGAPPLIRRLDGTAFVQFATKGEVLTSSLVKPSELRDAIGSFEHDDFVRVIRAICAPRPANNDGDFIQEIARDLVNAEILADRSLPRLFVLNVLHRRPELIETFDLSGLDASEIVELLDVAPNRKILNQLLNRLIRSPPIASIVEKVDKFIGETFVVAVWLAISGELQTGWKNVFLHNRKGAFSTALPELDGACAVAHAIQLIDFSTLIKATPRIVADAAGRQGMPANDDERAAVDAYLLVLSLRDDLATSLDIVLDVIPRLRAVALADRFSPRVRALLNDHLPEVSEGWDLNKRLMKVLRRAHRDGLPVQNALAGMALSERELSYVLDEDESLVQALISLMFRPFVR